jgi:hypothetical protein
LPFYEKKWIFLFDLNQEIQVKVMELLDLHKTIQVTQEYKNKLEGDILDLRETIHPKKENQPFNGKPYYQVFEQKFNFLPNLSIIDLLFNMGNESIFSLIHKS